MNWRDHLTGAEKDELTAISRAKKKGQAQARRIYDRCRKRLDRIRQTTLKDMEGCDG